MPLLAPQAALQRAPKLEIFVDGSNFNLALRNQDIRFDIDINLLATRLSRGYHFVKLRYYTTRHPDPRTAAFHKQQRLLEMLSGSKRVEVVLGRHEARRDASGQRYHVEKETDVNLAVDMVVGAYQDRFDVAMLLTGDTDYVRAVEALQDRSKRVVWCPLPLQSHVERLAALCDAKRPLDEPFLRTCARGGPR